MKQLFLTSVLVCLSTFYLRAQLASQYNLSFENAGFNGTTFCIEIKLSFDQAQNLGSSNLVFDFDKNVVNNPTIYSHTLSGAPAYYAPTLSIPVDGRASFNIELGFPNFGDPISGAPGQTQIARICFDYPVSGQAVSLNWYESGSSGTVVFLDDEITQLNPGTLQNYIGIPAAFPVEWLSFDAVLVGQDAQLNWQTGSELNNRHFEVERSLKGLRFEKIGLVAGSGSSSNLQSYAFVDPKVSRLGHEKVYYRLRQVDLDGSVSLSPVVRLNLSRLPQLKIEGHPNPFSDQLSIQYANAAQDLFTLSVFNLQGQKIWSRDLKTENGAVQVKTTSWARGVYFLSAENEQERIVYKILKL